MPPNRPPRVLLTEDDRAMRDLLQQALEDRGYAVIEAPDGRDALSWYRWSDRDRRFLLDADLVLTDYRMPGVDGLELLAAVRASDHPVPVILISAFADAELVELATQVGAAAVLPKPFGMGELLAVVEAVLEGGAEARGR